MTKHLFFVLAFLVAIIVMAVPGGDVEAQNGLMCPDGYSYTIKAGDWLSTIAVTYNVPTERLARINGIADVNTIRVGQVICLTDWTTTTTANSFALTPVTADVRAALPAVLPTAMPQYEVPATDSTSFSFSFSNTVEPQVKDPSAVDPPHRGVWESKHWFLFIASAFLVIYNLRVRWKGSKLDLIGAIACAAFAFVLVFSEAGQAGIWVAATLYLIMVVLSFVGDDDFSSLGLMCLMTAIVGSFWGRMSLLGVDPQVSLQPIQQLSQLWGSLDFQNMTLSGVIYGNLLAALLIFGRELWAELVQVGKAARDLSMPSNWNEFFGDLGNTGLTFLVIILLGFF